MASWIRSWTRSTASIPFPLRANQFSRIRKTRSRRYRNAQPLPRRIYKIRVKLRPRLEDFRFVGKLVPRSRFRRTKNGTTNLESRNDYGVDPVLQPDKSYVVQRRGIRLRDAQVYSDA